MKIAVFSTKKWVRDSFLSTESNLALSFFEHKLDKDTASFAEGFDAVCIFVNDTADPEVIDILAEKGVRLIALRCAGFNNVDIEYAEKKGIGIVRVPAYSPYAVAEHALGLILTLNRKFHRAFNRVREGNFILDGLLGFDIHNKTVGVIGTGKIGQTFINLMSGFECRILAYDKYPSKELEQAYVDLETLYKESDIISLHCPLTHETYHIINDYAINSMKDGVMIINTSRGALIDAAAVISGMKRGRIGFVGLDVYEEEDELFFEDLSGQVIQDDTFVRLLTFPNVLITSHQAFFTKEAIVNIVKTTVQNITEYFEQGTCENAVSPRSS